MAELWNIRHRDDEWFDEVTIRCVERYKTSGLSGDEWRFSYVAQFKRKGFVIHEQAWNRLRDAMMGLGGAMNEASDRPMGTEFEKIAGPELDYCAQPGCPQKAVSTYALKKRFCREGHGEPVRPDAAYREVRRFCALHLLRGDCSLEDSDANYEVLEGPGPREALMTEADESPSSLMVVDLSSKPAPAPACEACGGSGTVTYHADNCVASLYPTPQRCIASAGFCAVEGVPCKTTLGDCPRGCSARTGGQAS